ncbi:hypothetical protein NC652_029503 [Populus alba x Populus x berolinensis]|nr:hypothetical protein NC652_029503 [Populus alba x Populus x berolinensis]
MDERRGSHPSPRPGDHPPESCDFVGSSLSQGHPTVPRLLTCESVTSSSSLTPCLTLSLPPSSKVVDVVQSPRRSHLIKHKGINIMDPVGLIWFTQWSSNND